MSLSPCLSLLLTQCNSRVIERKRQISPKDDFQYGQTGMKSSKYENADPYANCTLRIKYFYFHHFYS